MRQRRRANSPRLAQARLNLYAGDVAAAAKILDVPDSVLELARTNMTASSLIFDIESQVGFAAGKYDQVLAKLAHGIGTAEKMNAVLSPGIPPTYLTYTVTGYERLAGADGGVSPTA